VAQNIAALVDAALEMLVPELEKAATGESAIDIPSSLAFIRDRLNQIKADLDQGRPADDPRFDGSMSHLVIDTWPLNAPLGGAISQIEYLLYRAKRRRR
jgi:hypothetical protein